MHNIINNLTGFTVTNRRWIPSERLHLRANGQHTAFDQIKSGVRKSDSKRPLYFVTSAVDQQGDTTDAVSEE